MRWKTLLLCVLSLLGATGCPDAFGKGGRIDRAAHQDAMELRQRYCSDAERARFCKDPQSAECREQCGG